MSLCYRPLNFLLLAVVVVGSLLGPALASEVQQEVDRPCMGALARLLANNYPISELREKQLANLSAFSDYSPRDCDGKVAEAFQIGGLKAVNDFAFARNLLLFPNASSAPVLVRLPKKLYESYQYETLVGEEREWYGSIYIERIQGTFRAFYGAPTVKTPPLHSFRTKYFSPLTTNAGPYAREVSDGEWRENRLGEAPGS